MYNILDIRSYLVTMDIEKEFESLDNDFLLSVLKKKLVLVRISFVG